VMACQAASATTSLREVLKAGPLCRQRTLDPKKISMMALNSTRPRRGTSLILYLRAVVMPRCSSRVQSLPARTGASTRRTPPHPHLGTSSHPRRRLGEGTLHWPCLLYFGPSAAAAPQQVSPESLGSQEPPTLSLKVPLPVMLLAVHRVVTPGAVARSEVSADQWAVSRCSRVRYGECKPSIIWKEKSMIQ
jgi:hypothetical protein